MKTIFDQSECQNLKNALGKEWLETNGLGGFASSTIIGANTRRQHGLLIASQRPPVERHVLLGGVLDSPIQNHVAFTHEEIPDRTAVSGGGKQDA